MSPGLWTQIDYLRTETAPAAGRETGCHRARMIDVMAAHWTKPKMGIRSSRPIVGHRPAVATAATGPDTAITTSVATEYQPKRRSAGRPRAQAATRAIARIVSCGVSGAQPDQ